MVCSGRSCRDRGADGVVAEIEELLLGVDTGCGVQRTGCLGLCSQAPAAVCCGSYHTRLRSIDKTRAFVARHFPQIEQQTITPIEDVHKGCGSSGGSCSKGSSCSLRCKKAVAAAKEQSKWNIALRDIPEGGQWEARDILTAAGYPAVGVKDVSEAVRGLAMPSTIKNYSRWTLESISPVSKHSAVFRLTCPNVSHPVPGREGGLVRKARVALSGQSTWHTTLLAEVGANDEGPLPWVERDYTPVSTAVDWEEGRCDLLVKIYPLGAGTSWLYRKEVGDQLWLSRPAKTLQVPQLVESGEAFRPASVLLLLAGTGAVAVPQILAHRDAKIAMSTSPWRRLKVPIDLLLSCREDDVLLAPQIAAACLESRMSSPAKGLRNATLLLTPSDASNPPYPDAVGSAGEELERVPNANVVRSRLTEEMVQEAYERMPRPCRVVVSGPGGFNTAVRDYLKGVIECEEHMTILSA